jgi:hypothetical protein
MEYHLKIGNVDIAHMKAFVQVHWHKERKENLDNLEKGEHNE